MNDIDRLQKEIEELKQTIKGLERDLDYVVENSPDLKTLKQAVLEMQEFLTRKSKGYDEDFYATFFLRE